MLPTDHSKMQELGCLPNPIIINVVLQFYFFQLIYFCNRASSTPLHMDSVCLFVCTLVTQKFFVFFKQNHNSYSVEFVLLNKYELFSLDERIETN